MTTSITNLSDRFSDTTQVTQKSESASQQDAVRKRAIAAEQKNIPDPSTNLKNVSEPTSQAEIEAVLEKLNLAVENIQRGLNFRIDESHDGVIIKVIDQATKETIRQIPSEEMLRIYERLEEVNSLLFDDIKV
ncbi:flagellar protein FlaG [Dasania sp. GY-MA-18]|uniref:Flagellar protein FlaG n=1 Tax=Dasania phycosphaerae TaxID=2950436 RepID=A0A9J6RIJ8_9GAMM|nr:MULTISPECIES: flagellar protein FlaG [Dasania]MCR8921385.1 flagellar protein FlaG [Dasania sp. GY-MA-18]MCZ0863813.1 flagellar protein FlaG [Dasania phycosphaerae]MCZ0867541.1 flagellar protein FlaG [Dasania phycosphaerae]